MRVVANAIRFGAREENLSVAVSTTRGDLPLLAPSPESLAGHTGRARDIGGADVRHPIDYKFTAHRNRLHVVTNVT
jgi:hypothetical protein